MPSNASQPGTIFVCRVRQLDCDFYGIVGPYAHFLAIERGARFIYFLDGEPRDYLDHPLNSDDLLLPPWRIQYRAKTFSPGGFPFQRIEGKADPEAFFTSHPTIQADSAEPGPYDRPPGGRPAPISPNMSSDFSVAWHLVAAHWLRTEGPAA